MDRMDLTPYRRITAGFDRLFELLEGQGRTTMGDNYPPFNIERRSEDTCRVALVVAGFRSPDLEIAAQHSLLTVC